MPPKLALDNRWIEEVKELGRPRIKGDRVNAALREYIERRKQQNIVSSLGTID